MISLRSVSKVYPGGVTAVDEISFDVDRGETLVLVGASGCGKTTTLKLINRLEEASGGEIRIDGSNIAELDPDALRRRIGYVFQGIGLFPHRSVGDNIAAVPRLLGWERGRIDERVDALLDLVGLPHAEYRERRPHELSGGQQQRVGVARALAAESTLLLMDEPFGAVDPITRDGLQRELIRMRARLGLTIVMVTHDVTEALLLADRVAVLDQGRLLQLGTPAELFAAPADPQVERLLATPRRQIDRLQAIAQAPPEPDFVNRAAFESQLALLPEYLSAHLLLTVGALAAGVAISLPLAILVLRVRPLAAPLLATAGVIQTIPGLALLALMVPLLGRIGIVPALLALTLYSVLPVLRNTVTGALEVDRFVLEAARGIGMTATQTLFRVQLPLALPTIVAGLRTAAVWTVGTATLSTPVGATSLGNYIFSGLQTQNMAAVLVGCSAAAVLAMVLDGLIRLAEVAASRRDTRLGWFAAICLVCALGLGGWPRIQPLLHPDSRPRVIVGAKTFSEQYILARMISDRLEARGFAVETRDGLGSTVVFDALVAGEIDLYVDYSGTLWANHMGRGNSEPAEVVLAEAARWLDVVHGALLLGPLGFENAYALAMRREHANELGVESLEEIAPIAHGLEIGGDYEFFARPEWAALRDGYGFDFAGQRSFDSSLMYAAVADGHVDIISAFSSDGRIAAFDLLVLDDPREALPPYDAILLLSPGARGRADLLTALKPLIDAIDDSDMRTANKLVDVDGRSIREAAEHLATKVDRRKVLQRRGPRR